MSDIPHDPDLPDGEGHEPEDFGELTDPDQFAPESEDLTVYEPADADDLGAVEADETHDEDHGPLGGDGEPSEPEIDLELGDDHAIEGIDDREPATDLGADDWFVDDEELAELSWPDADVGLCSTEMLGAVATLGIGEQVDPARVEGLIASLGTGTDDLGLGVDARQAVRVLESLGMTGRIEHSNVDDVLSRLDAGQEVVIDSADGPMAVLDISDETVRLERLSDETDFEVSRAHFEDRWSGALNEIVVAEPQGQSAAEVVLDEPEIVILPVTVGE